MKNYAYASLVLLVASCLMLPGVARAQDPTPVRVAGEPAVVFKAGVDVVTLAAAVRDGNGRVVRDLERADFEDAVETDGRRALDAITADMPDVLILDVMLPSLDGYEILRALRASRRAEMLPVLMLTARGQREDRRMALDCGADMFIAKPFANAELVAAVKALAEGRPVRSPAC